MKNISDEVKYNSDRFREIIHDYEYAQAECVKLDKTQQDLLHVIEFSTYDDRSKISTQLAKVRKERRMHKDTMGLLEPMYTLLNSPSGADFTNRLTQVLGQVRKQERYLQDKCYYPRVMKNLKFINGQKV